MDPPAKGTGVTGLSSQSLMHSRTYMGAWRSRATASPTKPMSRTVPLHSVLSRKMLCPEWPVILPDQSQDRGASSTPSAGSLRASGCRVSAPGGPHATPQRAPAPLGCHRLTQTACSRTPRIASISPAPPGAASGPAGSPPGCEWPAGSGPPSWPAHTGPAPSAARERERPVRMRHRCQSASRLPRAETPLFPLTSTRSSLDTRAHPWPWIRSIHRPMGLSHEKW